MPDALVMVAAGFAIVYGALALLLVLALLAWAIARS